MSNSNKRLSLLHQTVGELSELLDKLDPEASVTICGSNLIWIHVTEDGKMVSLDTNGTEEHY